MRCMWCMWQISCLFTLISKISKHTSRCWIIQLVLLAMHIFCTVIMVQESYLAKEYQYSWLMDIDIKIHGTHSRVRTCHAWDQSWNVFFLLVFVEWTSGHLQWKWKWKWKFAVKYSLVGKEGIFSEICGNHFGKRRFCLYLYLYFSKGGFTQ